MSGSLIHGLSVARQSSYICELACLYATFWAVSIAHLCPAFCERYPQCAPFRSPARCIDCRRPRVNRQLLHSLAHTQSPFTCQFRLAPPTALACDSICTTPSPWIATLISRELYRTHYVQHPLRHRSSTPILELPILEQPLPRPTTGCCLHG
jgi:hypothetical protein